MILLETTTTAPAAISIPTLLLSAMVWIPAIGAIALLFFPSRTDAERDRIRSFAISVAAVVFGLGVLMWYGFSSQTGTYAFEETRGWLPGLSSSYHLGVDGVSMPLLLLSSVLFVFALMASPRVREQAKEYFILLLVLETGVNGVFASLDYLLFFLFWQLQAIPMFLLVARFGAVRRLAAAWKLLAVELASSALLLLAILILYRTAKTPTFDIATLHDVTVPAASALLVTWLFFIAFAVKLPVFPFHTWLTDGVSEASPPVALLLAGIGVKLGGYGLLRVNVGEFHSTFHKIVGAVIVIAVISVLWSAVAALAQDNLRRLVAYVVMSHMGLVLLAAASGSPVAINGAVLLMVADGLGAGLLVLIVAAIVERANTTSIRAMGGMAARMTRGAVLAILAALAAIGFPGLASFVGQLMIVMGAYGSHRLAIPLALLGVLVLAAAMIWTMQRIFFGVPLESQTRIRDLGMLELTNTIGLLALIVLLGLLPGVLMDSINFSVITLLTGAG
ncbi:MAG TPA: NADH-quinone oxidoreductase subunit M [Candidatus Dormibacteraeota bacterium]|nr:NADH-quinone oxidoreductase subunit M [Candidatus Dormibacteraeota bacterium]